VDEHHLRVAGLVPALEPRHGSGVLRQARVDDRNVVRRHEPVVRQLQTSLVAGRRIDLHRRLGTLGAILAIATA